MAEETRKNALKSNLRRRGMVLALVFIIAFFGVITRGIIFRPMNISNLFMQNSYVIFITIGMFFCIITGNVDLSVGSVVAVAGALVGYMTVKLGLPTSLAVAITVAAGIAIGILQGSFIAFLNVPPFIVTLAGMLMFRGLTMVILMGQSFGPFSERFRYFASGFVMPQAKLFGMNVVCLAVFVLSVLSLVYSEVERRKNRLKYGFDVEPMVLVVLRLLAVVAVIGALLLSLSNYKGMPFILLILIAVTLIYNFVANNTVMGRHVYAVGGNIKSARLCGVRTRLVMFLAYVNSALLATIAGLVVAGRLNAATVRAGTSYELDAIAACYIGGCSASGGTGTIMGAIIGAAVMAVLNNGMSIMGIGVDMQQVIKGGILLLAVTFDVYSKLKAGQQA